MHVVRLFLGILCLFVRAAAGVNSQCGAGHKCYPFRVISTTDTFEIRRYDETLWVTWQEHGGITALTDFPFLVEYTDRVLSKYFNGHNYFGEVLHRTTPLRIDVQLFNLQRPRRVSYPVHVEKTDGVPAPFHPLFVSRNAERYVYVRSVPSDLPYIELLHAAAEFMSDLAIRKYPFDKEQVNLVIYDRPKDQVPSKPATEPAPAEMVEEGVMENPPIMNEIWIGRTIKEQMFVQRSAPRSAFGGEYGGGGAGGFGRGSGFPPGVGDFDGHGFSGRRDVRGPGYGHRTDVGFGTVGSDGSEHLYQNYGLPDDLEDMLQARLQYFDHRPQDKLS